MSLVVITSYIIEQFEEHWCLLFIDLVEVSIDPSGVHVLCVKQFVR